MSKSQESVYKRGNPNYDPRFLGGFNPFAPYIPKDEPKPRDYPKWSAKQREVHDAKVRLRRAMRAFDKAQQPKRHIPIDKLDKEFIGDYRAACAMLGEYFKDGGNMAAFPFVVWMETFMGPYTAMWWFKLLDDVAFCKWSRLGYDAGMARIREIKDGCKTGNFQGLQHLEPFDAIRYRGRLCGVRHCSDPRRVAPSPRCRCAYLQPHSRYTCVFCAPIGSDDFDGGRPGSFDPARYSGVSRSQGVQAHGVDAGRVAQNRRQA